MPVFSVCDYPSPPSCHKSPMQVMVLSTFWVLVRIKWKLTRSSNSHSKDTQHPGWVNIEQSKLYWLLSSSSAFSPWNILLKCLWCCCWCTRALRKCLLQAACCVHLFSCTEIHLLLQHLQWERIVGRGIVWQGDKPITLEVHRIIEG